MKTATLLACCLFSTMVFAQPPCKSSATGDLHVETFESTTYGESQTLRIWLPNAYTESANAQTKYPVLYVLDGQNLFDDCTAFANEREWRADETIAGLIAAKKIAPLIVVGIDSGPKRKHQYRVYRDDITDASAPDPIGAKLPAFLATEVLPYVGARYRVTSDPRRTGIGGASLAGVAASFILLNRPDLFGVGLIESATLPLGNGQMLRDSAHIAFGPDRVFVGVGTTELAIPGGDKFAAQLRTSLEDANAGFARMAETLAANLKSAYIRPAEVMLVVEPNANHSSASWARRFPAAITFLYGD